MNGVMMNESPNLTPAGNILPGSFVKVGSSDNTMLQCGANQKPIGVVPFAVQDSLGVIGSSTYIGTAANSSTGTQALGPRIWAQGSICHLRAGTGGLTVGDDVISDANGYGVTASATYDNNVGARALSTVLVNELCLVQVLIGGFKKKLTIVDTTTLTDTATVSAATLLKGALECVPVSAATYTLPTSADLVAALPGATVGYSFDFLVVNNGADSDAITMAAGSGGDSTNTGTMTVAQNVCRLFRVVITSITTSSESYKLYGIE